MAQENSRMPKVAVCFAGLPRFIPASIVKWRSFVVEYSADVFVHTWAVDTYQVQVIKEQLHSIFCPTQTIIDLPKNINTARYTERIWAYRSEPRNVLSMWYSIQQALNLALKSGRSYDIICRARFDWWCEHIDLYQQLNLTVPDDPGLCNHHFTYLGDWYVGHNDQFGYGSPAVMQKYSETFDQIPWLYNEAGVDFCSELFLTANMIRENIPITYQKNMQYRILK